MPHNTEPKMGKNVGSGIGAKVASADAGPQLGSSPAAARLVLTGVPSAKTPSAAKKTSQSPPVLPKSKLIEVMIEELGDMVTVEPPKRALANGSLRSVSSGKANDSPKSVKACEKGLTMVKL